MFHVSLASETYSFCSNFASFPPRHRIPRKWISRAVRVGHREAVQVWAPLTAWAVKFRRLTSPNLTTLTVWFKVTPPNGWSSFGYRKHSSAHAPAPPPWTELSRNIRFPGDQVTFFLSHGARLRWWLIVVRGGLLDRVVINGFGGRKKTNKCSNWTHKK